MQSAASTADDTEARYRETMAGKVVVITGGARGIGGATAELLAGRGASVVIGDVLSSEGEATVARIAGSGGAAHFVPTDVTDGLACQRLMSSAIDTYGKLDVLLCCAGILRGAFQQVDVLADDVFWNVLDVNVRGTFLCAKAAVPHLRKTHGVLLLLASGAGVRGGSSSAAYGASKGGVNGLGMTLEGHLAADSIRVNVICPGSIGTTMKLDNIADAARAQGADPQNAVTRAQASGAVGDPRGVARILAFLASDQAAYLRHTLFTR